MEHNLRVHFFPISPRTSYIIHSYNLRDVFISFHANAKPNGKHYTFQFELHILRFMNYFYKRLYDIQMNFTNYISMSQCMCLYIYKSVM